MLRFAVTTLTAVTVLWHAVVGCCAHHEHREDAIAPAKAVVHAEHSETKNAPKRCCCKCKSEPSVHREASHSMMVVQEIAESQSCEPDSERPSVPCEEEQCVLTDGKFVSALESVHNDLLAVWQAVDGNLCIAGERSKFEQSEITSDFPPPLRTHLVLHILLI